jgi:hypothetical protein
MRYEIVTYSATILARKKTPNDGCMQPKYIMWKLGDEIIIYI